MTPFVRGTLTVTSLVALALSLFVPPRRLPERDLAPQLEPGDIVVSVRDGRIHWLRADGLWVTAPLDAPLPREGRADGSALGPSVAWERPGRAAAPADRWNAVERR
jgi:hypothetical protein